MKAIVYQKYGSPDVLELKETEKPSPKDNEVLVKVYAASINDWDWGLMQGTPFVNRMLNGLLRPKRKVLGSDIAGRIEAVGKKVQNFKPGDEVYGDLSNFWGGFAEYVCARENLLALKPSEMTFEQAAAIPQAAMLAVQGLLDKGRLQKGHASRWAARHPAHPATIAEASLCHQRLYPDRCRLRYGVAPLSVPMGRGTLSID